MRTLMVLSLMRIARMSSSARHAAGVTAILNVGTGDPTERRIRTRDRTGRSHESIYTAIGTHPSRRASLRRRSRRKNQVADRGRRTCGGWGEIGLDFHYDNSPRDVQVAVFKRQLHAARDLNLPVIIHTREAGGERSKYFKPITTARIVAASFTVSAAVKTWRSARSISVSDFRGS